MDKKRKFKVGDVVEHDPETYSHSPHLGRTFIVTEIGETAKVNFWIKHKDCGGSPQYEWAFKLSAQPTDDGAEEYNNLIQMNEAYERATNG